MKLSYLKGVKAIAFDGAYLSVEDQDRVTHTISVDPGPVDLTPYAPLTALGEVELSGFLIHASSATRGVVKPVILYESAASETYTPSLAEKQEAQMRHMVRGMVTAQLEREREKAAKDAERLAERKRQKSAKETPAAGDEPVVAVSAPSEEVDQPATPAKADAE